MNARCADCPLNAAGLDPSATCASVDWPGYCGHATAELARPAGSWYWRPKILGLAGRFAPAPPPAAPFPARFPPDDPRVRVGLLCPVLTQAGAEQWQSMLARSVDPALVAWAGCNVMGPAADPAMLADLRRAMPVRQGGGEAGARALAAACDVLVTWSVDGLPSLVGGIDPRPAVVSVCHSPPESSHALDLYSRTGGIDLFAAVSGLARDALPGPARAACKVIGNCVDPARLAPARSREAMHAAWGIPPGALVAAYYGRLAPEKGWDAMVRLAKALGPPWHVAVVGPDYTGGAMAAAARDLPRLHLCGADPGAGDVLRAVDVLVVPSHFESFGLSIAEAVWAGTPVVSTEVGLALMIRNLTRLVPHRATGEQLAAQVEAAVFAGRPAGQMAAIREARARLDPARFGREWTGLLVEAGAIAGGRAAA